MSIYNVFLHECLNNTYARNGTYEYEYTKVTNLAIDSKAIFNANF